MYKNKSRVKQIIINFFFYLILLMLTTTGLSEEPAEQETCAYFNFTFKDGKKLIKPGAPEMLVMNGALPIDRKPKQGAYFSQSLWSSCQCEKGANFCSDCEIRRCISNIVCNYGGSKKKYEGVICNLEYINKENKILSKDKCPTNPQDCLDSQGLASGIIKTENTNKHHFILNGLKVRKTIKNIQKNNTDIITTIDENMY